MKNRKTVVVAFLLVAAMLLGVGYAALTDTLTLDGRVTIDMNQAGVNFDEKIYWSAAKITESTNTSAEDVITGQGTDDLNFTLHSLATKGDVVKMTCTIKNESNVRVKITVNEPTMAEDYGKFSCTYEYENDDMTIPAGGTMDVYVVVTVANPVTSAATATFGISYVVETAE